MARINAAPPSTRTQHATPEAFHAGKARGAMPLAARCSWQWGPESARQAPQPRPELYAYQRSTLHRQQQSSADLREPFQACRDNRRRFDGPRRALQFLLDSTPYRTHRWKADDIRQRDQGEPSTHPEPFFRASHEQHFMERAQSGETAMSNGKATGSFVPPTMEDGFRCDFEGVAMVYKTGMPPPRRH